MQDLVTNTAGYLMVHEIEASPVLQFLLCTLVVWWITYLLHEVDGPKDILLNFRKGLNRNGIIFQLLKCYFCLSFWVGLVIAATQYSIRQMIFYGIAMSAGAFIIESLRGD